MAEKKLGEKILLRMKELEDVKRDYDDRDNNIARYVNPRRELIRDSQRYDNKGERRGKRAYSGLANSALGIWADGMQGHMVSQTLKWFKAVLTDNDLNRVDEVQQYLQRYDEAMYGEFRRSNFYDILGEWFRDAGSIGTATLFTEEDIGKGLAVHTVIHPREIFIAEDMYGNVDTVFRKFFLTAKQAVEKFDDKKLSQDIVKNAEEHPEKRHEFIHAVYRNTDRMFGSILAKDKKWASVYVQKASNNEGMQDDKDGTVVRQSGFDLNPYSVWRLRKNSDEIYGYSPAADAMVEIIKSHQMAKTLLEAAHRAVKSPLNVPEHMRGNVRLQPDGHNYYERGGDIIKPIQTSMQYPIAIDREEKIQRIIEDAYRVDFFLILQRSEREKTATEIMELQSEKAVLLGPQVDRLENEGLRKKFDIVSDIADKANRLPEPPQILIDAIEDARERGGKVASIDINFIGPLAQAQRRLFQMQPIKNGLNELAQASVIFPKVLDRVHQDRLAERILDSTDFPQDVMRTDAELEELREEQALERAQAEALQAAQAAAESYPKITGAPEEGSPAKALQETAGI
jgi:hypothetical protein